MAEEDEGDLVEAEAGFDKFEERDDINDRYPGEDDVVRQTKVFSDFAMSMRRDLRFFNRDRKRLLHNHPDRNRWDIQLIEEYVKAMCGKNASLPT